MVCQFQSLSDLHQRAGSDSGTVGGCRMPCPPIFYQLGPERKQTALGGFGGMNGAAIVQEKRTGFAPRLTQPQQMPRTIDVTPFEFRRTDA